MSILLVLVDRDCIRNLYERFMYKIFEFGVCNINKYKRKVISSVLISSRFIMNKKKKNVKSIRSAHEIRVRRR